MIAVNASPQSLIDRILTGATTFRELRELRQHPNALVRSNAIRALAPSPEVSEAIEELVAAAEDSANATRLMGTIRVSHLAVESLFRLGTPEAFRVAETLLCEWPEPDRSDLLWYLRSEGHTVLKSSSGINL